MAIVKTQLGQLSGHDRDGVHSFLGIPYARPPVGELRFRPPAPPARWDGVRPAIEYGPTAKQLTLAGPLGHLFAPVVKAGDDYLNLNVWTPDPAAKGLPVLVWIHGGAFMIGSGSEPYYDGTSFARDGIVAVSINYRLGAQGFLYEDG